MNDYIFYTYIDYWKDNDNTIYGVGGSNFSGWYRKVLIKEENISKDRAEQLMKQNSNINCAYINKHWGSISSEWFLYN